jgi:hypothetical protein
MTMRSDYLATTTHPLPSRARRSIGGCLLAVLLIGSVTGMIGCGGKAENSTPPAAQTTTTGTEASMVGATKAINLTSNPQLGCTVFNPRSTTVHKAAGDKINFTTSMPTVSVTIPAGLISVADTTITLNNGQNTPAIPLLAGATGTYVLTSNPAACSASAGDSGPSITVGEGEPKGGKP